MLTDMKIELKPETSRLLSLQIADGLFATVEDAVHAAVLGLPAVEQDLSWAAPYLAAADADIEAGRTFSEAETFAEIDELFEH